MRWVRMRQASGARRDARRARDAALEAELREAVVRLMSAYDCRIVQEADWLEVHGRPEACRFRIDVAGRLALLDAGTEGEYVAEWVLGSPGELADLLAFLHRLVEGDLTALPAGLGGFRLAGYGGYLPAPTQPPRPDL